jgi:predicted permease
MNARAIRAIIRKDLKVVSRNKGVMLPIIIAPLFMFVILPWIAPAMPFLGELFGVTLDDTQGLISQMPAGISKSFRGMIYIRDLPYISWSISWHRFS